MTITTIAAIYFVGVVLAWGMVGAAKYKIEDVPSATFLISIFSWAGVLGAVVANLSVPPAQGRPYILFRSEPRQRKAKALPPVKDVYNFEDGKDRSELWREEPYVVDDVHMVTQQYIGGVFVKANVRTNKRDELEIDYRKQANMCRMQQPYIATPGGG